MRCLFDSSILHERYFARAKQFVRVPARVRAIARVSGYRLFDVLDDQYRLYVGQNQKHIFGVNY